MNRRVYVGGTYGHTPTVVAATVEHAMRTTVHAHRVPSSIEERGYDEQWACEFVDGYLFRCTTTIVDGSDTHRLYVEGFEVECKEFGP